MTFEWPTIEIQDDSRNTLNDVSDIPPLQGDYAKTVFLWCVSKPQSIHCEDNYAAYLLYECGIRDCAAYHKKMIDDGYLEEAETEEALNLFKVTELKELLRELGQPVSGKKEILIERILENAEDGFLTEKIPETVYRLSMKGRDFLQQHWDYVEIHRHKNWDISWTLYDEYARPEWDFLSTAFVIMKNRLKNEDIRISRNTYYNLYSILREQGKRSDALEMLLRVLYLDCSGIFEDAIFDLYKSSVYTKEQAQERIKNRIFLAPGIISPFKQFHDFYDPEMIDILYEWKLPIQVCDKKLFSQIVENAVSDTLDEEEINRKLQDAFNRYIDRL